MTLWGYLTSRVGPRAKEHIVNETFVFCLIAIAAVGLIMLGVKAAIGG